MILNYSTKISKDCVIRASVLKKVSVSEMLKIGNVFGMTVNLETEIFAIVKDNVVKEGDRVERSNTLMLSKKEKLGVNALGEPIDGKGAINATETIRERKATLYFDHSRIIPKTHPLCLGGISYNYQPSKYGQYNYIHKRTMWRMAIPVINSVIHKTKDHAVGASLIPKRNFTHHTYVPKSGKQLAPKSETAKQESANHPLVGKKNPDGKTVDMKGNLSHSKKLPKALNREDGTDLTESPQEDPQYFHLFTKSYNVPASDFVEKGILSLDGTTKEQKIEKATENQIEEN